MKQTSLSRTVTAAAAALAFGLAVPAMAAFPDKPVELVCSTSPGSGAARWCQLMAQEMAKPLGVSVNVSFKSGGSNWEPTLYLLQKPADGYTILHMSGSFGGYFNLPHFKAGPQDLEHFARVEQTIYSIGVLASTPWKTANDLISYARENPNKLTMGSNKVGSIHHRHHVAFWTAAGAKVRFVPYRGTGDVVKDILGGHLPVGFAQPGLYLPHVQAGKARVLIILNEERLDHPVFKDVPIPSELGINYDIPHQWQGMSVKRGTPREVTAKLVQAVRAATQSAEYKKYSSRSPHVLPVVQTDIDKLNKSLEKTVGDARKFMLDNGMIKGN